MKIKFLLLSLLVALPLHAAWYGGMRPDSFAELAKQVKPAVVNIATSKKVKNTPMQIPRSPFGGGGGGGDPFEEFRHFFEDAQPREEVRHSLGSGFIIGAEGLILTNNHVVGDADEIEVVLLDGRKFKATVVGRDAKSDLAVIRIKTKDVLPAVKLGDSDAVQPGEWVMAVGNPFGFEHTVTVGVVSAKGRLIDDAQAPLAKFIQTDASINPGNSGGPLFNLQGEVIGINSMIYGMGTGIGFAIPVNLAKNLLPQLISEGKVTRGWLGVQIQRLTPELAESYGLKTEQGALIGGVFPGSPAEAAGVKVGDIILEIDGKKIEDVFDLTTFVSQTTVGKAVTIKVLREGKKEVVLTAKITKRKEEEEEKMAAGGGEAEGGVASDILGLAVRNLGQEEAEKQGSHSKKGVVITKVEPGSSAENNDLRIGDILYEVNDQSVGSVEDYRRVTSLLKKGSVVRLLVGRDAMTIFVAYRL